MHGTPFPRQSFGDIGSGVERLEIRPTCMNAEELIGELKIASPCRARWEDMEGTDQSRFCHQCQKNVYNFAKMSADEAQQLLVTREGRVCGRFYRRSDGTLLTADCPIGMHRRVRKVAYAAILLLLGATSAVAFGSAPSSNRRTLATNRNQLYRTWDDLVWEVKGWFGVKRPMFLLGDVCVPTPKIPTPAP
jgi:hypothetical protein